MKIFHSFFKNKIKKKLDFLDLKHYLQNNLIGTKYNDKDILYNYTIHMNQ